MGAPLTKPVEFLVVHCSATPAKVYVDRAVIDRWHRERGWLGIGYHYVIKRDGTVEVGRGPDPLTGHASIGAHVEGYNDRSLGICLAGGMDAANKNPENNFTAEQFASLQKLLYQLLCLHSRARICGHNELNPNKACPSFDVPTWWHSVMNEES